MSKYAFDCVLLAGSSAIEQVARLICTPRANRFLFDKTFSDLQEDDHDHHCMDEADDKAECAPEGMCMV